ncbi:MAG: cellulose biosynthesis cyclic di-GMP-binding regulatory protein BcsB [Clostridium sp.]|uniref:cellulose biosynthesis cyclic di-GMP-binding regulatory protein BcsB n=1 Tax=Clostridium sp. TaxID=1506 RepID=UPI002911E5C8|nr:cellulose biosynthesis cyclic di-GMP-binding regulatory protein BcsB [Clostridium sp.]MDU5109143.1 cellulose biosynthesis cyclic di-GMP-binding regulatory protein BcsB [Clostridium sp.]
MKVYKKIILLPILFIVIFTMSFSKTVKADSLKINVYSYTWEEDTLLSGSEKIGKTFYVPENMRSSNFVISLKIKQSPTLIKDLSSVSVSVNNTKVYSIMMDKINDKGELTIKVPGYLINKGENSIVINGFLKSTREKCEYNNDVNWILIEKNSSFSFDYSRTDSTYIRDIFDNTYYSDGKRAEVNLVLPNELEDYNYSQASSVSTLIGFAHKSKELNVDINPLKYSDLNNLDKESIVLGTVEQVRTLNKKILTDEEWKNAEENGYIAIRKIGKKNHFIIISSTEEQLETLCRILSTKSSLAQIKESNYILDKSKVVNEKEFNENPSLKDLGYESTSQVGNGIKEFNYYLTIPASKTLTNENKVSLSYSYSNLVDFDNGYVNVEINGQNILSKKFVLDKTQDTIDFSIPEKYFDNTAFNISIKFNLRPSAEYCTSQSHEDVWVQIDSDNSNFKLALKDREKHSLINSQGILQDSNGMVQGRIVVDSYDNLSVDSISKISYYLGKLSQGVNNLYINNNDEAGTENSNKAIFALTTSQIIKDMKDQITVPISDDGEFIEKDLFIQNTAALGAIELTSNNNLLITASDKDQLNNTIKKYPEITSNKSAVIIKDGEVIDYFEEVNTENQKNIALEKINYNIVIALVVLVGAVSLMYIIYYRKVK